MGINQKLMNLYQNSFYDEEKLKHAIDDITPHTKYSKELIWIGKAKINRIFGRYLDAHENLAQLFQMSSMQFSSDTDIQKSDVLAYIYYEIAITYKMTDDIESYSHFLKIAKLLISHSSFIKLLINYQLTLITVENNHEFKILEALVENLNDDKFPILKFYFHYDLGNLKAKLDLFLDAHRHYEHAQNIAEQHNNLYLSQMVHISIAFNLYLKREYDSSLKLLKSIKTYISYAHQSRAFSYFALIYEKLGNYDKAIDWNLNSLHICQDKGVIGNLPNVAIRLGEIYEEYKNNPAQAKFFYQLGYLKSIEMMNSGISLTGSRRKVVERYISFFSQNYNPSELEINDESTTDPFLFARDIKWNEVKKIFQYNLCVYFSNHTRSISELLDKLQLKRSTFTAIRTRLGINDWRQLDINKIDDVLMQYIDEHYNSMSWKEIIKQFETTIFEYFQNYYGNNKSNLAKVLGMSYPNISKKLSESRNI